MKYFGTDGVRGKVGKILTVELALELGKAAGAIIFKDYLDRRAVKGSNEEKPVVVLGKDTRLSSDLLENALTAGLASRGVDVLSLGVIPTPAVAYITRELNGRMGAVISASHNPYYDNGIKFFGNDGFKIRDDIEEEIEELLNFPEKLWNYPTPEPNEYGVKLHNAEAVQKYVRYITQTIEGDFTGMHVALDCANGATSSVAPQVFSLLNAKVSIMGNQPNGLNINEEVGSVHPEALATFVQEVGADIGFAFDGDGDRLIAVDSKGNVRDGDYIIFLCAQYLKEKGKLNHNTVVSTIMANLGFHRGLEELGIQSIQTDVGDRYVAQAMLQGGYILGGEQSGHIIFLEHLTTGDGLLSAVQLLAVLRDMNAPLSEASKMMKKLPQMLVNLKVNDKEQILSNPLLKEKEVQISEQLGSRGRLLLRPSGTEPLIRVMVEAETEELCQDVVHQVLGLIKKIINA